MRGITVFVLVALVIISAVVVSAADTDASKPCAKKKPQKLLSIEQRYPHLVRDYHPEPGSIDPNAVPDKVADRTARVIIREHLAWEKENPPPPKQLSTAELKEEGLKIAKQTLEIQKEHRAFKVLAKAVDDDDRAYKEAEIAKKKAALERVKKAKADAIAKAKIDAEIAASKKKSLAIAAAKKAKAVAKAKAKQAKASGRIQGKKKAGLKKKAPKAPKAKKAKAAKKA